MVIARQRCIGVSIIPICPEINNKTILLITIMPLLSTKIVENIGTHIPINAITLPVKNPIRKGTRTNTPDKGTPKDKK